MSGHGEVIEVAVHRRDGKLGLGLNASNRITDVGPQDGLRMWDMVVSVDGVSVGPRTMAETLADVPPKDSHVLTVLRLDAAPPTPRGATVHDMSGWLQKQSPVFPNPWQNRKCKVHNGHLWYVTGEDGGNPKSVDLSSVTSINVADLLRCEFRVVTPGRTFMFRAANKVSLFSWVKALQLAQMKANATTTAS